MIVPIIHENDADGGGVPIFRNAPADEIERLQAENERLRSLIGEWAYSADERAIHLRSGDLSESIDKRHYDACEALVKAVGFPRLARQEFETDDLRRDLPA